MTIYKQKRGKNKAKYKFSSGKIKSKYLQILYLLLCFPVAVVLLFLIVQTCHQFEQDLSVQRKKNYPLKYAYYFNLGGNPEEWIFQVPLQASWSHYVLVQRPL